MELIFKEVGQGDSIIIHWKKKNEDRIILIDCNLKTDGSNPTLKQIQSYKLKKIDLIVLSHPHTDHFSGLQEILQYAQSKKIIIDAFMHTCYSNSTFLQTAVKGNVAKKALKDLFVVILDLKNKGEIKLLSGVDSATREFDAGLGWKLKFLAPHTHDYMDYNKGTYKYLDKGKINKGDANILSTVIKIYKGNRYYLLMSDCPSEIQKEIIKRELVLYPKKEKAKLTQVSHHGSIDSFCPEFMEKNKRNIPIPAVISVGHNDYGHPSEIVKDSIRKMGFTVHETNVPANEIVAPVRKTKLSMISSTVTSKGKAKGRVSMDQVFVF